ncbi:MAG: hypothetical protein WC623_13520 [Pedobacter sp.]|uniref:hypothetical protein n=1 Tax=Pedobacter sp. TaxID=1411316 RepID=UPI00356276A1
MKTALSIIGVIIALFIVSAIYQQFINLLASIPWWLWIIFIGITIWIYNSNNND